MGGKHGELVHLFPGKPSEDHIFARIVQHLRLRQGELRKDPVSQALKAHDVDVQCPVVRVESHDLLLGLHRRLLRRYHKKSALRFLHGQFNEFPIYIFCFSGTGTAGDDA